LVSLDGSTQELFTFYTKEDLQRDAKSILGRVVAIARRNKCRMSSKYATKTRDLLKPDRVRIHRQFMLAMSTMVNHILCRDKNFTAVTPNTFLLRNSSQSRQNDGDRSQISESWTMHHLDTQLLASGQLLVVHHQNLGVPLIPISNIHLSDGDDDPLRKPSKILLMPVGRYARYAGGHIGKVPTPPTDVEACATQSPAGREEIVLEQFRQKIWKSTVVQWLRDQDAEIDLDEEEENWVEVEIPFLVPNAEQDHVKSAVGFQGLQGAVWKSVLWPTSLALVNSRDRFSAREEISKTSLIYHDPLMFVEEWVSSIADRAAAREKGLMPNNDGTARLDTAAGSDNYLDARQYSLKTQGLDGQSATAVYPTPPDGPASQIAPGVASADDQAGTPGALTTPRKTEGLNGGFGIVDSLGSQMAIGSGLYDQELFEDVPGRKFGAAEMADEPNWDFFDEPDIDLMQQVNHMEKDAHEQATNLTPHKGSPSKRHHVILGADEVPIIVSEKGERDADLKVHSSLEDQNSTPASHTEEGAKPRVAALLQSPKKTQYKEKDRVISILNLMETPKRSLSGTLRPIPLNAIKSGPKSLLERPEKVDLLPS
jgi:hypothetical protein